MRNPVIVLENLQSKTEDDSYTFKRLFRNLYNPDFYLLAYNNIYSTEGNMTKGYDGNTIDGMSLARISRVIEKIKNHTYKPNPVIRKFILKKNGKKRPLGLQSIDDKLVQEVIRMILESIYDYNFKKTSHGFRPNKSCHTALKSINLGFTGVKWFVEGDISAYFDTIDHHTLINIMRRRIKDEYFIGVIWKFLKGGYIESQKYNHSYSGTVQGSIISPILSNIYLNELDTFIDELKIGFDKGTFRKINPEYNRLNGNVMYLKKKHSTTWESKTASEKIIVVNKVKKIQKSKLSIQASNPMDASYRRLVYIRYADDFLVGVIGSKMDAISIKSDISNFLEDKLKLKMSEEKTLITNSSNKARFLGFDITVNRRTDTIKNKNGVSARYFCNKVRLLMPRDKWQKKLVEYNALKINKGPNGKEIWEPIRRGYLKDKPNLEILKQYNSEIVGLYNYYSIAENASTMHRFKYVMEYSMYKTFAAKYESTVRKIRRKFNFNGRFAIRYTSKKGSNILSFYNGGFKRKNFATKDKYIDKISTYGKYSIPKSLISRILSDRCEWCFKSAKDIEVHHVRKLKSLIGLKKWEKVMIDKNRKTLVLCSECHQNLHMGLLD